MDLQAAYPGGQFENALHRRRLEVFHQRMDSHAQGQVEHVVAVFDENVFVAGLPVDDAWYMAVCVFLREHGG